MASVPQLNERSVNLFEIVLWIHNCGKYPNMRRPYESRHKIILIMMSHTRGRENKESKKVDEGVRKQTDAFGLALCNEILVRIKRTTII